MKMIETRYAAGRRVYEGHAALDSRKMTVGPVQLVGTLQTYTRTQIRDNGW